MALVGQRNSELVLIAALPTGVIAAAKKAVPPADLRDGYRREHDAWAGLFQRPAAEKLIRGGLEAGAQTRDGERNLEGLLRALEIEVVNPLIRIFQD
ncbi:hypothetical protein AB4099_33915 [Bosea sp. 2KB_26]|uniref:hypothetical protein n=1 Tax=Bosea sp. 2KB_26 TaxID=3237475 RepID=UPI003F9065BA